MKKTVVSLLLVFVLAVIPMISMATDYSSMSEEELNEHLDLIYTALESKKHEGEQIIMQADGMTIYFNSAEVSDTENGTKKLTVKATSINAADKPIGIVITIISINRWEMGALETMRLMAGNKARNEFYFYRIDEGAEINALEDIKEIRFYGYSFDPDTKDKLTENLCFTVRLK